MKELNVALIDRPRPPAPFTPRDWAAVGFRQRRVIVNTFLAVFGAVVLITWLMPTQYESETEILVKRERTDPVISPDNSQQASAQPEVTEQDLNSEVEILHSHDLLEKVAVESGLRDRVRDSRIRTVALALGFAHDTLLAMGQDPRTVRATVQLDGNLKIEPLKKTKLIKITYRSPDPRLSNTVLQTLVRLYMEKHLEVHRAPGAIDFFQAQADHYRQQLSDAEKRIAEFGKSQGGVAPQLEKEVVVRKLNDFKSDMAETRAAIAATERRITELQILQAARPSRLASQVKTSDNPLLLQQMKSTLLTLQLKRTELLNRYSEEYSLVKEVNAQIAQTQEAITKAERTPVREEVTDRDATHEWLTSELVKTRAELTSLRAKLATTSQTVDAYNQNARQLNGTEVTQQDLVRKQRTAEESYLLYSRKQEEARISQELDQKRIFNVSVAENPTLPAIPASPNWPLNILLGALLAVLGGVGVGLALDYIDPSFRTPDEVEAFLGTPVLASLSLEAGETSL
jgi:uncharacterized protein involved in exopolysaccharide biosynthesis